MQATHYSFNHWRRFFARGLDFVLYVAIISIFCVFVLRINITNLNTIEQYILTMVGAFLMIVIEPLFLWKFRTTPGKKMLGLTVYNNNGTNLTYAEGFKRTALLVLKGEGLFLGIVQIITNILCYRRLKRGEPTSYDEYEGYVVEAHDLKGYSYFAFVALNILVIVAQVFIAFTIYSPIHKGDITKEQYIENINHYFYVVEESDTFINEDGVIGHKQSANQVTIQAIPSTEILPVEFIEENGYVTSAKISVSTEGEFSFLPSSYLMAVIYGMSDFTITDLEYMQNYLYANMGENFDFHFKNITVINEVEGIGVTVNDAIVFGDEDSKYDMTLTVTKN